MSIPSIPTVPSGTGGGLFGSIKRKVLETPLLYEIFGDRVHIGQVPPGKNLPFIVITQVSARSEYAPASDLGGNVTYINIWYVNFQVSTYAVGYESARVWSKLLHDHIDRSVFAHDCFEVIPYVSNQIQTLDPKRSEDGREVWHFSYRYDVKIAEYMAGG